MSLRSERPTVRPCINLPSDVVDEAIETVISEREAIEETEEATGRAAPLEQRVLDAITQRPVFHVDGQPLDEYAAERGLVRDDP